MADLRLLTVHAHPDDESSKGAATIAKYHAEGVETVLVCCTGGEQGDILNPAMDRDDVRANLHQVRMKELATATEIIGFDHVEMLGYRDSGMAGTDANADDRSFARAPADDAIGKLVALIRRHRPQVVITYGENQEIYPHPDHLRTHDITVPAFVAAGDPNSYPDAGEPFAPSKLYYSVMSCAKVNAIADGMKRAGMEVPFTPDQIKNLDDRVTTIVDVAAYLPVRNAALIAHATQIDPESPLWFGLPDEGARAVWGIDEYELARSTVAAPENEDDLFAGLR